MSDVPHPNWWQASDGKWYPPESSPNVPMNRRDTWTTIPGSTFRKCLLCGEEFTFTHFTCRKRDPETGQEIPRLGEIIADRVFTAVFDRKSKTAKEKFSGPTRNDGVIHETEARGNDRKSAQELRASKLSDLESLIVRVTNNKSFVGQLREPNPHTVMSARELLLQAYETPDVDKARLMLKIAMELLVRTSSLSFTNEHDRLMEIEGASFWRGVIGGILQDSDTSQYFELNFLDISTLVAGGVIDRFDGLRKMGRCNEERGEWLRFLGDPESAERFRLAIKAYEGASVLELNPIEGASMAERAQALSAKLTSTVPQEPSSFLQREGSLGLGAILGSSSAYDFRSRLSNKS
jgi:hypothetical protein